MKYTLTIFPATLLAIALAGPASTQTNPAATNPGAAPPAANAPQGKQASGANPADGVKQKVEDAVTNKLKSAGIKDLKSVETKALEKVLGHHKHKKAAKIPPLGQAAKDQASSV